MRVEQAHVKRGPRGRLMGAVMGLALFAGVFLSLGAPSELDTAYAEVGKPAAAESSATTPARTDTISPGEEVADRDGLGLQLD